MLSYILITMYVVSIDKNEYKFAKYNTSSFPYYCIMLPFIFVFTSRSYYIVEIARNYKLNTKYTYLLMHQLYSSNDFPSFPDTMYSRYYAIVKRSKKQKFYISCVVLNKLFNVSESVFSLYKQNTDTSHLRTAKLM